jgi:hypothetical protein
MPDAPKPPVRPEELAEPRQLGQGNEPRLPEQLEQSGEPRQLEQRQQQKQQLNRSTHRDLGRRGERSRQPTDPERKDFPEPTEDASLRIKTVPVKIEVSAHGPLAVAIVGPAATIAVGHLADFPVWAVLVICALQIVAAVVMRRRR